MGLQMCKNYIHSKNIYRKWRFCIYVFGMYIENSSLLTVFLSGLIGTKLYYVLFFSGLH